MNTTYTLIKGCFYAVGFSPDGDSIRFQADEDSRWLQIQTENREKFEQRMKDDEGLVTLRLQGVDALETHYAPPTPRMPRHLRKKAEVSPLSKPRGGSQHQPGNLGRVASNAFMAMLGVQEPVWRKWGRNTWVDQATIVANGTERVVEEKLQDRIPGYIVCNDVERNGRPIAWVFAGEPAHKDGSRLSEGELAEMLPYSANYKLLQQGLVYPYFFMTLPGILRGKLIEATQAAHEAARAQANPRNIWTLDETDRGIDIRVLEDVTERYAVLPYLFRRIVRAWHNGRVQAYHDAVERGAATISEEALRLRLDGFFEDANPHLFVVSTQDFTRLDSVLSIEANRLTMHYYPYDLVFLS